MKAATKSRTLRELEANSVREVLQQQDVTPDEFPELSFWRILEDYVYQGYGCSGSMLIPKLDRILRFQLCVRETGDASAVLLQHWRH